MRFSPRQRAYLVAALGEETVAELERKTKDKADLIKALGIEFKSLGIDLSIYTDLLEDIEVDADKSLGWISSEMGLSENKDVLGHRILSPFPNKPKESGWISDEMGLRTV